ncbi:MAG: YdcF family protein [Bauldia sp.]
MRARRRRPAPVRVGAVLTLCAVVLLAAGFVDFARGVSATKPPVDPHADAIVVLTGGVARIDGALDLLADGHASRVLISGVNRVVTPAILADTLSGDKRDDLACCVDLGHDARNTIGNAAETRQWAESQGFTSLIVVTSDYHMARSMIELRTAMPAIRLIPYPVNNPDLHLDKWWWDPPAFGLLVREYAKLLYAKARLVIAPSVPPDVAGEG